MRIVQVVTAVSVLSCRQPGQQVQPIVPAHPKPVTVDQLDQPPVLVEWPALRWVDSLRAARDSARVVGQIVLDTTGRVERESFIAHGATPRDLGRLASDVAKSAVFSPGRQNGKAQRVMLEVNIDLIGRTLTPLPVSDALIPTSEMVEEAPEMLSGPALVYPQRPRAQGITGRVLVRAILNPDGRVDTSSVRILKSVDPDLDEAAVFYILNATFKPMRWHGKKARCIVNVPVDFKIGGRL